MDVWAAIADERRTLADLAESLTDEQLATPSLCGAWTVRDVFAHLCTPHTVSKLRFLVDLAQARGSFDRANQAMTRREAQQPIDAIAANLRAHADGRFTPPGLGTGAPLSDVMAHGADIRIPLGVADTAPVERWTGVLDFAFHPRASLVFLPRKPLALQYVASDADWSRGSGDEVRGPAAALALALLGRDARADELAGPGADRVRAWLAS